MGKSIFALMFAGVFNVQTLELFSLYLRIQKRGDKCRYDNPGDARPERQTDLAGGEVAHWDVALPKEVLKELGGNIMKKVTIGALGLALSAIILLAACTPQATQGSTASESSSAQESSGTSAANADPVTLEFWDMLWGPDAYATAAEELSAKYTDVASNVTVNYTSVAWSNWFEQYSTALASNAAPDVATGGGYMPFQFAASDETADLKWIYDEWKKEGTLDDFLEDDCEYWKWNDKYLAIPSDKDFRVMIIRKDWLDEAGLSMPKTWDDVYETAKVFSKRGEGIYGLTHGAHTGGTGTVFIHFFGANYGGILYDKDGNANIDNEGTYAIRDFLLKLRNEGLTPESVATQTGDDNVKLFASGNAGMIITNNDQLKTMWQSGFTKDQVAIVPPLTAPNGNSYSAVSRNGQMIFEASKNKQTAMEFLKWFNENSEILWTEGQRNNIPARISFQKNDMFKDDFRAETIKSYAPVGHQFIWPVTHGIPSASYVEGQKYDMKLVQGAYTMNENDFKALVKSLNDELQATIDDMDK
ncbi:sugar ABC transporter substrate-binding protein [Clostridium sp. BSD2780061688st1 E8]|uniref:ABC transporter substrate-binding protein n=1 Tax=unclassified Clostridium TaxID=2614128 RepID=UPI001A9C0550|nr:sugar ABC transporter substrate-binding protein [Clostridium sp. BSD2780061688st1 E8]